MPVVIRASGVHFNVSRYASITNFLTATISRKGDPVFPKSQPNGRRYERSGITITITVSEKDFDDLSGQVNEATVFLETHRDEIVRLAAYPGVEGCLVLDFGVARRDVYVQCDYLPPELVRLAGELGLGIEISRYPIQSEPK